MGRDQVAKQRDRAAARRDRAAETLDREAGRSANHPGALDERSRDALVYAAGTRARASADRSLAAADRRSAAMDRKQASDELELAHLDDLTGAYRRGMGGVVLRHEVERAQRTGGRLVFAYIDVDGLKEVNDREGHEAGDELLCAVVAAINAKLRSYDPLVRVGGDEFLCALADTDLAEARLRFEQIGEALEGCSITVGLSEMRPDDSVASLTNRSDAEMRSLRETTPRA